MANILKFDEQRFFIELLRLNVSMRNDTDVLQSDEPEPIYQLYLSCLMSSYSEYNNH